MESTIVCIKNPGLAIYCYNFLFTFTLFKTKAKHRFAHFLITLSNSPLGIGVIYNHMIKKWAKQINLRTQDRIVNNRKKQKPSRPGFFIRTMVISNEPKMTYFSFSNAKTLHIKVLDLKTFFQISQYREGVKKRCVNRFDGEKK